MELYRFWFRATLQHQILRIFSVSMICSASRRTTAWLYS